MSASFANCSLLLHKATRLGHRRLPHQSGHRTDSALVVFHPDVVRLTCLECDFAGDVVRCMIGPVFRNQLVIEINANAVVSCCAETILARQLLALSLPVQRAEKLSAGTPGPGLDIPQSKFELRIDTFQNR